MFGDVSKSFIALWLGAALLGLLFWGTVIFVAAHFILKLW